jgi:hypothetical protein
MSSHNGGMTKLLLREWHDISNLIATEASRLDYRTRLSVCWGVATELQQVINSKR